MRAMPSEGYWAWFRVPPPRSLNYLPQARQRNRRQPWAIKSGGSVAAVPWHVIYCIVPTVPATEDRILPDQIPPKEAVWHEC